jgi:prevent-host-death family protein
MERVSASDLEKHLSARLERVRDGESLLVTDREQPVAILVPLSGIESAGGLPGLLAAGAVRAPKERFRAEEWDRLARPPADSPGLVAAVREDREER